MFKKDTRRGLALGAAFSLLLTAFAGTPAQAAVDVELKLTPLTGTSTSVFVTDEFDLVAFPVTADGYTQIGRLAYYVEKADTTSALVYSATSTTSATANAADSGYTFAAAAATESVIIPTASEAVAGKQNIFSMKVASANSSSDTVVIKVTAFIDANSNGKFDSADVIRSATQTVNFITYADVLSSVALTTPFEADTNVYATGSLSGINTTEMDGTLYIAFQQSSSAGVTTSYSVVVSGATYSTISAAAVGQSVSAALTYKVGSTHNFLGTTDSSAVTARATKGITVSPVAGDNLKQTAAGTADARVNSAFVLSAYAYTGSLAVTTSVKVASLKLNVTVSPALTSTRSITINGVVYTDSAKLPTSSAVVQGTDGKAAISVSTFGWENAQSASFTVTGENWTNTVEVQTKTNTYTVTADDDYAQIAKGGSVALGFSVEDQWEVLSTLATQRVKIVLSGTGFTAGSAQYLTPVAGKVTANVTAAPDSVSGILTVTATIQTQDQTTGNWVDGSANDSVAVTVGGATNSFTVKPSASYSASISYGVAMSWSGAITANVGITGSDVVISSPGLLFKANSGKTYSDTVTVRAGAAGVVTFYATARLAGTYTVSMVSGVATGSTQVVVAEAAHDAGAALSFDKTSIVAGATSTITGKLVDANGNPVATGGTASLTVKWTGKGLPFNLGSSTQTDEDGEFSFQVLVLGTELGEAAISATYMPTGSSTSTKNLTFAQKVDVVAATAAATPSADQKLTVGTFNGYIAIYAKGYAGQKLSAKVAGKWLTVEELTSFQRVVRKTGAGYSIKVDLYIDGVFAQTSTTVTK